MSHAYRNHVGALPTTLRDLRDEEAERIADRYEQMLEAQRIARLRRKGVTVRKFTWQ